jgi:hypothetical protein
MKLFSIILGAYVMAFCAGCKKEESTAPQTTHHHEHKAPHGGTPVELGEEEYHLELLIDPAKGLLSAYVLDGELENFVRLQQESFRIMAKNPAGDVPLSFKGVANTATGEKLGDTSLFEAQSDWLKSNSNFDGILEEIMIKGKAYRNVQFNFPKGNDHDGTDKK